MITTATIKHVAGLKVIATPCPKCGGAMFEKICPCKLRHHGWMTCAKCMNPKCAHTIGIKKGGADILEAIF